MNQKIKDQLNEFIEKNQVELSKPVKQINWDSLHKKLADGFNNYDVMEAFYSLVNSLPEVQEAGGFVAWSGVKTIREYYYPTDFTSITIPEGIKEIGELAFYGCTSLKSITIPDSIEEIGKLAFNGCTHLTSVVLPKNLKKLSQEVFYNCNSLTSIVIPGGVEEIDGRAFAYCSSLTSITLPKSLKKIGTRTFVYCINLKSITYLGTKADWSEINEEYQENPLTINCLDGTTEMI